MSCSWGHKYVLADSGEQWPPKFTYLILASGGKTVAFADPRKFGACKFGDDLEGLNELAPDGLIETVTPSQCETMAARIADQRLGIKALILDQKRVVSGVGNWVADEVLYQSQLHPDQSYLTSAQSQLVVQKLHSILSIAVNCLDRDVPYPDTWLFGYRWTGKKAGKDCEGRSLSFLQSGGRTSAIVEGIQKLSTQIKDEKRATAKIPKTGKKKASTAKVEQKKPANTTMEATKLEEEATTMDQKHDIVIPRKRKIDSKETKGANKKRTMSGSSIEPVVKSEGHEPDVVRSAATPISIPSSKVPANKSNRKLVTKNSKHDTSDSEKESILKQIDQSVKEDFRTVGFAKWRRRWLPIVQLGPYDIEPGAVRDDWMKLFRKTSKHSTIPRLVYWYGSPRNDLSSSFSFLNANTIVSYTEGIEQNCHKLSSTVETKRAAGKKLTFAERMLVEGLAEIEVEVELSKEDRLSWLKM
eukprot:CAMPEP_0201896918 /NCGR_PEP_ID=MMETSP0902-20130614/45604_1 /ASSEMBLY_ACC=CAM_ASM_000551 /TAXON_ID=420261 /ORGANISM="Thalassiosira antarctica, Strain CCMP982" /LENGTH=470 /DNA_ID=CAMNT_0048429629 /DNA_START=388 /DNA_END=1800 /DNA_ORIENTATION=-